MKGNKRKERRAGGLSPPRQLQIEQMGADSTTACTSPRTRWRSLRVCLRVFALRVRVSVCVGSAANGIRLRLCVARLRVCLGRIRRCACRVLRPCCELLAVRAHRPPRAPPPRSARPRYFCFESLTTTNARTDTVLGYEMLSCAGAAGDCVRPGAGPVRVSVFFMCQRRRERTHMRSALIRTDPHCLCAVGAVTPYCKSCKSGQARSAHSWDTLGKLGKVDAQGKSTRQIHKANPWGQGGQGGTLCTQLGYIGQLQRVQ